MTPYLNGPLDSFSGSPGAGSLPLRAMSVVEIKDLVKHYGNVHALQGVSLSVEKGEIYGLLGRNGAGKTTMIKILLSIVRPTSGNAHLLDFPAGSTELRKRVGYLPEDHRFPDYHNAYSLLDFYGALYGMSSSERQKRTAEVLDIVDLVEDGHRKIRTYSKGMKQRVGLAQAMLHDPDVYFLDEPTDGVDPIGRKKIREVLVQLKDRGKTIFVNSHILSEVEMITSRVSIIEQGQIIKSGTVADLTRSQNIYDLTIEGDAQTYLEEMLSMVKAVRPVAGGLEVHLKEGDSNIDRVIDFLRDKGISFRGVNERKESLEDIFIQTVENR